MSPITIMIFVGFVAYYLYSRRPKFQGAKVDYSFGDSAIQKIKAKLEESEYTSAEFLIQQLDADDLHQAVDHVTLNGGEALVLKWKEEYPNSEIVDLFLGVSYMHQASVNRGYGFASGTSNSPSEKFTELSNRAKALLQKFDHDKVMNAEAYSRLIRIYGWSGNYKKAKASFEKCQSLNPEHLWAHIEYAELTQPKWGVDIKSTNQFIDGLTEASLVNQIIYLKYVWDSVLAKENLFGGSLQDLKKQAKELLFEIDAEVNNMPPNSIQKYVLYNYMTVVSEEFGIRALNKKYNQLMNGNFTLYPFGIMK